MLILGLEGLRNSSCSRLLDRHFLGALHSYIGNGCKLILTRVIMY